MKGEGGTHAQSSVFSSGIMYAMAHLNFVVKLYYLGSCFENCFALCKDILKITRRYISFEHVVLW